MGTSIVQKGAWEYESNSETAEEMVKALKPAEEKAGPVVKVDRGKTVEADPEKDPAAVELGKKGAAAAAKAREERAKEAPEKPKEAAAAPEKAKDEPGEAEDKAETPGKARRDDPAVRIRQLAAEKNALAQRLEAREREFAERLERLEKATKPAELERRPEERPANGRPSVDDFATYEEHTEALTDWKIEQRLAEREKRAQAERFVSERQTTAQKRQESFISKVKDRAEEWQKVDPRLVSMMHDAPPIMEMDPGGDVGPANYITEAITQSEDPTGFALYLSENEEVVKELINSDPWHLPMKLGRIEARFADKPKEAQEERPRFTPAPPPVRPVAASAIPSDDITADIPFDEFVRRKRVKR